MPDPTHPKPLPLRSGIAVLGVPLDHVTADEATAMIEEMVRSGRPHHISTVSIRSLVLAREDDEFRHILLSADLALCESRAAVWASRFLGKPLPCRISTADLLRRILRLAVQRNLGIYLLGRDADENARVTAQLQRSHPGLLVVGSYTPPSLPLHEFDHDDLTKRIQEAAPDLLFVCFGSPKQEKWIAMNYGRLGVPVSIGIGSWLDDVPGASARVPGWARVTGLAWLAHQILHPVRFVRRYLHEPWVFAHAVWRQVQQLGGNRKLPHKIDPKPRRKPVSTYAEAAPTTSGDPSEVIVIPRRLDAAFLASPQFDWDARVERSTWLFADCAQVEFVDSTGVGCLVRLQKRLRARGGRLILFHNTSAMARVLELLRITDLFPVAKTLDSARLLITSIETESKLQVKWGRAGSAADIFWSGEVNVDTIETYWQSTEKMLMERDHQTPAVTVDVKDVSMIDSYALHSMLRMMREARRSGVDIRFVRPSERVQRVAQQAGMVELLFAPPAPRAEPESPAPAAAPVGDSIGQPSSSSRA